MGLDMFLDRVIYVGAHYGNKSMDITINIEQGDYKYPINVDKVKEIREHAWQWRNSEYLHDWFTYTVMDDPNDSFNYVSKENLQNLLDIINHVLENKSKANVLLPNPEYLVSGQTPYNKYYFEGLEETKKVLEEILNDPTYDDHIVTYEYMGGW